MNKDRVWSRVYNDLDECDVNSSDLEVIDVWPAVTPESNDMSWATNLTEISKETL